MVTVRTVISIAASHNWPLDQIDIHNVFLQASRQWNLKLTEVLLATGYSQSSYDHSLFIKKDGEAIAVILIYVDDLLIIGNSDKLIQELKDSLHSKFKMKDLDDLKYFRGIEILRSKIDILLNKRKYAFELISDTGLSGAKSVTTPLEANTKLTTVEYDELTGVTNDPVFKDITSYQRLIDWAACPNTRRSVTGYLVTVSRSSIEAEYKSMAGAVAEVIWIFEYTSKNSILRESLTGGQQPQRCCLAVVADVRHWSCLPTKMLSAAARRCWRWFAAAAAEGAAMRHGC
ncbi:uncharacterized mitochondrial protein AtMg00810-like [Solanum dulcamara]|uniref:uncharacterized mitochondrial protein AtMg00810-like n=1 Tax=Solanum dulcamara TaxID=45834 RepID=UPI002486712C|nr:uncharacterized mitochondrial protein AtMg00810-like [Solanum dulcamara]